MVRSAGVRAERSELRKLVLGIVEAPYQKQAPGLEVARMGGVRPGRHALSRVADAAASAFVGQARSRESEGAISASGDDASRASPQPLSDRRRARPLAALALFARLRIAELGHGDWPRSGEAPARHRGARFCFSAPKGIAHSRAPEAAAAISESNRNPVTLVTPRGPQAQS